MVQVHVSGHVNGLEVLHQGRPVEPAEVVASVDHVVAQEGRHWQEVRVG